MLVLVVVFQLWLRYPGVRVVVAVAIVVFVVAVVVVLGGGSCGFGCCCRWLLRLLCGCGFYFRSCYC